MVFCNHDYTVLACSNESLAHSYHTNRTNLMKCNLNERRRRNFLPRDMNKTAANASTYIACKGIYKSKTDYNCRSTKLGENDANRCLMMNVGIKKILPRTCFLQKSHSVSSTWKRSEEEVTYNSPDVK